jgi:molybdenum cofactor biosynthesis enzyme
LGIEVIVLALKIVGDDFSWAMNGITINIASSSYDRFVVIAVAAISAIVAIKKRFMTVPLLCSPWS